MGVSGEKLQTREYSDASRNVDETVRAGHKLPQFRSTLSILSDRFVPENAKWL